MGELIFRYLLVSDVSPWTILGLLLAPFWNNFGVIFGVFLSVCVRKVVLLAWKFIFQSFYVFRFFFAARGHLCM